MTDNENIFAKTPETVDTQIDTDKIEVRSFVEILQQSNNSQIRRDKIEMVKENRELREGLHALLPPATSPKRLKSDFYFQIPRRYDEEGLKIPQSRILPKAGGDEATARFAQAARDEAYEVGGYSEAYAKCFDSLKTDGTSYIQTGWRDDEIVYEQVDLSDIFIDVNATDIRNKAKDRAATWMARRYSYTYSTFIEIYPHMEGKVTEGSPLSTSFDWNEKSNSRPDPLANVTADPKIEVFILWHKTEKKKLIIAGGTSREVSYEDWDEDFPIDDYHFSLEKYKGGHYSMGLYDVMKDIAEVYKGVLNDAVSHISKTVNPYIFLFTDQGEDLVKKMKHYELQRQLGRSPIITSRTRDTELRSVAPTSISNDLERILGAMLDSLGRRLGINVRQQEVVEQTATEFIRKSEFENAAISSINKVNTPAFKSSSERTLNMIRKHWKISDTKKLEVTVQGEEGEPMTDFFPAEVILEIIKDFEGNVDVDTSISPPLTTSEKVEAQREINIEMTNLMQIPFVSLNQAKESIKGLKNHAELRGIDLDTVQLEKGVQDGINARTNVEQPMEEALA